MKNLALGLLLIAAALTGCRQAATETADKSAQESSTPNLSPDTTVVNVLYFHGKARCKTCIAVGAVAKQAVGSFAGNEKVVFTEINISENDYEDLVEKYQVTWNALIIMRGNDAIEITDQAFATAISNPQALEKLVKDEIAKRL